MTEKDTRSRYDELFDRFHTIESTKKGTRYEILAAMVCKSLEMRGAVIHDLRMVGDSGVKHQIDVSVEVSGESRRYLIECKDFDVGGEKVGLGIVEKFESVVRDTSPDEAWIVTCMGFTGPALQYAKAKKIKPVIMRLFEEKDLDGRILRIALNIHVTTPKNPRATIWVSEEHAEHFKKAFFDAGITDGVAREDDAYFLLPDGRVQHFNEVLAAAINDAMSDRLEGIAQVIFKPEGRKLIIGGTEITYLGIMVDFEILTETETVSIVSDRIAELILQGVQDNDIVIFADQIERLAIDPDTGEIKSAH